MASEWHNPSDEEILAQIPAARERGRIAAEVEPRAVAARFDANTGWTVLELANGCLFAFPPSLDEVRDLTAEQRTRVRVRPGGRGLYWEGTDAVLSVPALMGGEYAPRAESGAPDRPEARRRSA